jgi:hypothetical protein
LGRRLLLSLALTAAALSVAPSGSEAAGVRRLNAGLIPAFYLFDSDYFGIGNGGGMDLVLRYEIRDNIFIENRLGGYAASQDGHSITGFNGQLGATVFLPYWIPWRPTARAGLALMTANPVVSEPVQEFRPSQTVFYTLIGLGITRSITADLHIEAGVDLLFTPYSYRVYEFYRQYVEVSDKRFTHAAVSLGISYIF